MSLPPDFGPYRIVREIGAGAMGTVYEAADTALHRKVALKVITTVRAADPGFRERFVREAQAQASLDSPHVVQVFAHGQVGGQLYIASQLIPDGDLGAMLRRHGPPPPAVAVDLIAQVADGLAEAHRVGLVHRDIKPANVLLRNRGTDTVAYLADFGIARQIGLAPGGEMAGTPNYMAPELHEGKPAGPVSDVYALGCLLWATVTGRAPDPAVTPRTKGRTSFDRELNRVLARALAKEPRDRHPSAAALRDDLRSLARTPPAGRRPSAGVVAATVGGIAAAVAVAVLLTRTGAPPDTAREETAIANIARALADQGDLDARGADCTARQLVGEHGVAGLQDEGVIDDDLMLVEDASGKVEPGILEDLLATTFSCLWPTG